MITSYKNSVGKYSALFNKATIDLTMHDATGAKVEQGSEDAVITFKAVPDLTGDDFYNGIFYSYDAENKEYVEANENFDSEKVYYQLSDSIDTLQQYYHYIKELNLIRSEIYTRLPIDEDLFEVDLNARTIKVPGDFNKNGVAVTGDKRAEYLWFKVPRYFDATDLSTKLARIEWKTAAKENNEGISEVWGSGIVGTDENGNDIYWYGYDLETEPEFIILGWCIEDILTENAGKVTFSLRFYSYQSGVEEPIVNYSLSTQPTTVAVKQGIGFKIEDVNSGTYIYDGQAHDRDRFENSPITQAAETAPEKAKFILQIPSTESSDNGLKEAINLTQGIPGTNLMKELVCVEAISTDGGSISYRWTKKAEDGSGTAVTLPAYNYYVRSKDTSLVENKVYYLKNEGDGGRVTYSVYRGTDASQELYERQSAVELTEVGTYTVTAINRVGNATNQKCVSNTCTIASAKEPIIEEAFAEQAHIAIERKDGECILKAYAKAQHPFEEYNVELVEDCVLTYQWFKDGEAITGATESSLKLVATEDNIATLQGVYTVKVTNTVNNTSSVIESDECRISFKAVKPMISNQFNINGSPLENLYINNFIEILGFINDPVEKDNRDDEKDSITYQWYSFKPGSKADVDTLIVLSQQEIFDYEKELKGQGTITIIDGATENKYTQDKPGFVFCVVTNHFNEDTATNASAIVQFHDNSVKLPENELPAEEEEKEDNLNA